MLLKVPPRRLGSHGLRESVSSVRAIVPGIPGTTSRAKVPLHRQLRAPVLGPRGVAPDNSRTC
eukprot:9761412-Alexandrium_andersonii.AAC.1